MEKKRGRKTTAALAIVSDEKKGVILPEKPQAPGELTDEEAEVWDTVIAVHDQGWLSDDQRPMLVQYCRHTIGARGVSQLIRALKKAAGDKDGDVDLLALLEPYNKLLAAQERESRALTALARSLRITNQARYAPHSAKARPGISGKKLWDS